MKLTKLHIKLGQKTGRMNMKKLFGIVILTLLLAGQAFATVEIERVVVGGVCRAWKHFNSAGDIIKIEVFPDAAIAATSGDTSVVGSPGWAAANLPSGGTLVIHPGTYTLDRSIKPAANVTISAYGAKLQRINQVSSTTTTAITAGATTAITVASSTGFLAGQQISILKSDGTTWNHNPITITSVVGNVITTENAWEISATGTTGVHLAGDLLYTLEGTKILGIELDGNKANWIPGWWGAHHAIQMHGGNNLVADCYIHDEPGEGLVESALLPWNGLPVNSGNVYRNNRIFDINGNGIHLSASNAPLIAENHIENTNLQSAAVGHEGGCITFSAQIYGAKIINNTLINGRAGVGQLGNSHVRIVGNQIRRCTSYAIEFITVPNQILYDAKIIDNDISDSVVAFFSSSGDPTNPADPTGVTTSGSPIITNLSDMTNILNGLSISGTGIPANSIIISYELSTDANSIVIGNRSREPVNCTATSSVETPTTLAITGLENQRIQIVNNRFVDTYLLVARMTQVAIIDNLFYHSPSLVGTNDVGLQIGSWLKDSVIKNNIFTNGRCGLFADGNLINVGITGNTISNAKSYYIGSFGTNTNALIEGNTIYRDANGGTWDATGIYCSANDSVKNNKLTMEKGSHGIYIPGVANVVVQGNTVAGALAGNPVTIDSGSTGYVVVDNQFQKAILDTPEVGYVKRNVNDSVRALTGTGGACALTIGYSTYTYTVTDNEDTTITFSGSGYVGDELTIIFTTAGTADEIITFHATLVSSVGTLTLGTDAGKYYVVKFISNGAHWFEVSRTAAQT